MGLSVGGAKPRDGNLDMERGGMNRTPRGAQAVMQYNAMLRDSERTGSKYVCMYAYLCSQGRMISESEQGHVLAEWR